MKKWSNGVANALLMLLLGIGAVPASGQALTVYTAWVPDYMISTGATLDQSTGLITEIAAGAFRQAHLQVNMAPEMPWLRAQTVAMTQPGAILLGLSRTPARERHWQWLALTFDEQIYAMTLQGRPSYTSILDMKVRHARVGTRLGSGSASLLHSNGIAVVEAVDTDTSFSQLSAGMIDVLLVQKFALRPALDSLSYGAHAELLSGLLPRLHATLLPDDIQQWMVASLTTPAEEGQKLRAAIESFRNTEQYKAILTKYEETVPHLAEPARDNGQP
ncbi:transporter substrate-binding domain-containing protein [Paludibacterium purpuratum]|uniref:Extracellular solute-binding protein (Family 3) n=1 Tax=Paludibacterium purpuratum TaxID=1144873 RepID=A0A4R7BD97_9NEIS|nr:transporter substrate-binding domain-containing protein [Paludibacterium purpuratum]TDR82958.1 extracellular solute-binding protein (family 3) [Paludibacterium purpuratum]